MELNSLEQNRQIFAIDIEGFAKISESQIKIVGMEIEWRRRGSGLIDGLNRPVRVGMTGKAMKQQPR